jgi:hypothetical protein
MVCAVSPIPVAGIQNRNGNALPPSAVNRLHAIVNENPTALLLVLALWLQPNKKDNGVVDE